MSRFDGSVLPWQRRTHLLQAIFRMLSIFKKLCHIQTNGPIFFGCREWMINRTDCDHKSTNSKPRMDCRSWSLPLPIIRVHRDCAVKPRMEGCGIKANKRWVSCVCGETNWLTGFSSQIWCRNSSLVQKKCFSGRVRIGANHVTNLLSDLINFVEVFSGARAFYQSIGRFLFWRFRRFWFTSVRSLQMPNREIKIT